MNNKIVEIRDKIDYIYDILEKIDVLTEDLMNQYFEIPKPVNYSMIKGYAQISLVRMEMVREYVLQALITSNELRNCSDCLSDYN